MSIRTLIVGASGGIGAALAAKCRDDGEVVTLSRSADGLDVTDEASIERAIATLDDTFQRVFVAVGILAPEGGQPERRLGEVEPDALAYLFAVNATGPLLVLKHLIPHLAKDEGVRIGILSARVGSIGDNEIGGWYAYRASKAALNQFVRTAAVELSRSHPESVLAALHPGTVATPFTADYQGRHRTVSPETAAENLVRVLSGLGPEETGSFRDQNGETVPW
ncbi:SDR family NAD(P)-dependent oxidoreductase [Notoacmeibacter sp. MSK16QG-6]|uniref:SDR family NAD(P)-dependent oxidoreductase n=1 Tax=Notoacmeibacter sp. MSK16QG-6 TaxID=2957982 RepID=UPI0020A1D6CD|nr:SDR family NAD(P)-dependent oxidoreductase [Notoacmeibacter sp. MSK16QG-6]MCP1199145.1 SDR family NAD(P)-dependent oxidoreductase [Notoacmeibacter sp. MSK16QG-6]